MSTLAWSHNGFTRPVAAEDHHPEAGDVLRLGDELRRPVDDVELANAVDHRRVAGLGFEAREGEGERLFDPDFLLDDCDGVVTVVTLVQPTYLQG